MTADHPVILSCFGGGDGADGADANEALSVEF
jgi:hypothetical protein